MRTFTQFFESKNPSKGLDVFNRLFQKAINDEISASILYLRIANELDGVEHDYFRQQMKEHSQDEYDHFKELLDIAANRGIKYTVALTADAMMAISDKMVDHTQKLETNAISDYQKLTELAQEMKEFDLFKKFKEILTDETEHFDDVGLIKGDVRKLG